MRVYRKNICRGIAKKIEIEKQGHHSKKVEKYWSLEPKLSEFYSDYVNAFCLCRTCVRQRQHMQV